MQFELIGSNTLSVTIGRQTISIPIGEQIEFQSGDFIGAVESHCIAKMRSADSFTYQSKLDNRSQQQLENSGVIRFHAKGSKIGFAVKAHVVHECEDEFDNVEIDHFNEKAAGNIFFSKYAIDSISPHNFSMYTNGDQICLITRHDDNHLYSVNDEVEKHNANFTAENEKKRLNAVTRFRSFSVKQVALRLTL